MSDAKYPQSMSPNLQHLELISFEFLFQIYHGAPVNSKLALHGSSYRAIHLRQPHLIEPTTSFEFEVVPITEKTLGWALKLQISSQVLVLRRIYCPIAIDESIVEGKVPQMIQPFKIPAKITSSTIKVLININVTFQALKTRS